MLINLCILFLGAAITVDGWLPVVTHWSLYRLHGFFMMKGACTMEILIALIELASKALSFATAILLYKNNRPINRGK